jgi:hypothetical protein
MDKIGSRFDRDRLLTFAFISACNRLVMARRDNDRLVGFWEDMSVFLLDCLVD